LAQQHFLIGITRVRNEALILGDTLDFVGRRVDAIIAYDDASTDRTVELLRNHPKVALILANGAWETDVKARRAAEHRHLGQLDDAWRCIGEAITAVETTKATIWETQVYRTAGELSLMSPEPDTVKAEAFFERALAVSRQQQAKSWELRAAMSMARLWRDQGKPQQARELLAPVYGWFTEGFDTLDLKEAKALLDELARPD
jgi:hypothetical protein